MRAFLSDPLWQFVGVVLALVAIVVTFWVYFLQKPRKRLLIERVARVPLTTIGHEGIPGLQITLNGEPVTRATVTITRIVNIGNSPMPAADFESPICLTFENGATILHVEILDQSPKSLVIDSTFSGRTVTMSKALLNPGDSFACRVLVQASSGTCTPSVRVVGMKDVETMQKNSTWRPLLATGCSAAMIGSFFLMPKHWDASALDVYQDQLPYAFVTLLAFMVMVIATVSDLRKQIGKKRTSVFGLLKSRL